MELDFRLNLVSYIEHTHQILSDRIRGNNNSSGGRIRRDLVLQFNLYDEACISVLANPPKDLPSDFDLEQFLTDFLYRKAANLGIKIDDKED